MKQENFVENIPGILLLSHGPFCQALLESAQMIGGEAVNVVALPLLENASIDEYPRARSFCSTWQAAHRSIR